MCVCVCKRVEKPLFLSVANGAALEANIGSV